MRHPIKQLLALLLVLCLVFSLAACTDKPEETGKATEPTTTAGKDTEPETSTGKDDDPITWATRNPGPTDGIDDPVIPELPDGTGINAPELHYSEGASFAGSDSYGMAKPARLSAGESRPVAPGSAGGDAAPGDGDDGTVLPGDLPGEPVPPAEPLKLTAAEWKDNDNWPFFTNLVNNGTIAFPSFGLDPRNRVAVKVQTEDGAPRVNETLVLMDAERNVLWTARTDKAGTAYLFWAEGQTPDQVRCGAVSAPVQVSESSDDPQGSAKLHPVEAVTMTVSDDAKAQAGMQIMFIVDTTGSMGDEIAYLQKDFSAIAERVGGSGVTWSANFYRDQGDEYVTRTNGFTSDVAEVQAKINAEYADGGGDTPEAVAEILTECLKNRTDWDENSVKLAFLIFDAPPHDGKDEALRAAVSAAAEKGIRLIPVVASNADRETELFGRAAAILTGGTYVFLTDDSGIGESHLEPIVGNYEVELLQDLIVRVIEEYRP